MLNSSCLRTDCVQPRPWWGIFLSGFVLGFISCVPQNLSDPLVRMAFTQAPYYDVNLESSRRILVDFFGPVCESESGCNGEGSCTRCFDIKGSPVGQKMSLVLPRESFPLTEDDKAVLDARVDVLDGANRVLAAGWLRVDAKVQVEDWVPVVEVGVPLSPPCDATNVCVLAIQEAVESSCDLGCISEELESDGGNACARTKGSCDTRPLCPVASQCASSNPSKNAAGQWECNYEVEHDLCGEGLYCNPRAGCAAGIGCYPTVDGRGERGICGLLTHTCKIQTCSDEYKCVNSSEDRSVLQCQRCDDGMDGEEPKYTDSTDGTPCVLEGGDAGEVQGLNLCIEGACQVSICGDGIVFGTEICDMGEALNSDVSYTGEVGAGPCRTDCQGVARYGDGIRDEGEECDDGNDSNEDFCKNDGTKNRCGDGFVNGELINGVVVEECDDNNNNNNDNCLNIQIDGMDAGICLKNKFNDGYQNRSVFNGRLSEDCDDGNQNENDGCHNGLTQKWAHRLIMGGTEFEGGGSLALRFGTIPIAIDTDEEGNLIVTNSSNGKIIRIYVNDLDGSEADYINYETSLIAGSGDFGAAKAGDKNAENIPFISPISISVDGLGRVFVVDRDAHRLYSIDKGRAFKSIAGVYGEIDYIAEINKDPTPKPANFTALGLPVDVAVDGLGFVYIVEQAARRVRRVEIATGKIWDIANGGVGVDPERGILKAINAENAQLSDAGVVENRGALEDAGVLIDGVFQNVSVIATTPSGDLLVSDHTSANVLSENSFNLERKYGIYLVGNPRENKHEYTAIPLYTRTNGVVKNAEFDKVYDISMSDDGFYVAFCDKESVIYYGFVNAQAEDAFSRAEIREGKPIQKEGVLEIGDGGEEVEEACLNLSEVDEVLGENDSKKIERPFFISSYENKLFISQMNGRIRYLELDDEHEILASKIITGLSTEVERDPIQLRIIKSFPNTATIMKSAVEVPDAGTVQQMYSSKAYIALSSPEEGTVIEVTQDARVSLFAGSTVLGSSDKLLGPQALAYDQGANLWVAEKDRNRIVYLKREEICLDGKVVLKRSIPKDLLDFSNVNAPILSLNVPEGISFIAAPPCMSDSDCSSGSCSNGLCLEYKEDACGNLDVPYMTHYKDDLLYVADSGNNRILAVKPWSDEPTFITVAGSELGVEGTIEQTINPIVGVSALGAYLKRPVGVVALRQSDFIGNSNNKILVVVDRGNHAVELLKEESPNVFSIIQTIGKPGEEGYVDVYENDAGVSGNLNSSRFSYPRGISKDPSTGEIIIIDGQDRLRALKIKVDGLTLQAQVKTISQGDFKPSDGLFSQGNLGRPQQMIPVSDLDKERFVVAGGVSGNIRLVQIIDEQCSLDAVNACNACRDLNYNVQECIELGVYCNDIPRNRIDTVVGIPRGEEPFLIGESELPAIVARDVNINGEVTGVAIDDETYDLYFARKEMRNFETGDAGVVAVENTGVFRVITNGFFTGPKVHTEDVWSTCRYQVCLPGTSWNDVLAQCEPWTVEEMPLEILDRLGQSIELQAPGALEMARLEGENYLLVPDAKQNAVFAISLQESIVGSGPNSGMPVFLGFSLVGTPGVRGSVRSFSNDDVEQTDGGIPSFTDSLLFRPQAVRFQDARTLRRGVFSAEGDLCAEGDLAQEPLLYISDTGNHQVVRAHLETGKFDIVAGTGTPATTAGGTPAKTFPLNSPKGLDLDENGNLYVASFRSIHILSPDNCDGNIALGTMRTVYGSPPQRLYPESATDCLTTVVNQGEMLYFMDACQGMLLRSNRVDIMLE